jgi:hypothetical protein
MANQIIEMNYKVAPATDVVLTIIFGSGQLGASTITGANVIIGEVKNWTVGTGLQLVGMNIDIHSVLTDVNAATNRLNADYLLTGGLHPQTLSLESIVDEEGDSDRFHVKVNFI